MSKDEYTLYWTRHTLYASLALNAGLIIGFILGAVNQ